MTLRNVIYYNDNANQIPLAGIANLTYPTPMSLSAFWFQGRMVLLWSEVEVLMEVLSTISSKTTSVFCKTPAGVF